MQQFQRLLTALKIQLKKLKLEWMLQTLFLYI
jgi:hypothetical protein